MMGLKKALSSAMDEDEDMGESYEEDDEDEGMSERMDHVETFVRALGIDPKKVDMGDVEAALHSYYMACSEQ